MESIPAIEWFGYFASVMVAISLMMKNMVKLRVINGIGCLMFCIYGAAIGAIPVAALNGFVALINVFYLSQMVLQKRQAGAVSEVESYAQ